MKPEFIKRILKEGKVETRKFIYYQYINRVLVPKYMECNEIIVKYNKITRESDIVWKR